MAAVVTGDIMEVRVGYLVNDVQCFNVLHYRAEAYFTVDNMAYLQDFVDNYAGSGNGTFTGEFAKVMSDEVTINRVEAQWVWPTRYRYIFEVQNTPGLIVAPCDAQNVQGSITKRGLLGNRHNIGGMRVGGLPISAYNAGELTVPYKALLEALVTFVGGSQSNGGADATMFPAILNKTPIPGSDPVRYQIYGASVIVDWEVQTQLRTQRTRTKGHGT